MPRMIDADKLHYIPVYIANKYGSTTREIVVFAKDIDKLAGRQRTVDRIARCPFCGRRARTFRIPENDEREMLRHPGWQWSFPGMWVIGCETEGCIGSIGNYSMVFTTENEAIETWNRRAT